MEADNMRALREAFKKIDDEMSFCDRNVELGIGFSLEGLREHCRIVREILKSALALPPRQCDIGTAEEQVKRYKANGEVYHTSTLINALAWAQMPYESEAANAKQ